jgi:hypothetical protein
MDRSSGITKAKGESWIFFIHASDGRLAIFYPTWQLPKKKVPNGHMLVAVFAEGKQARNNNCLYDIIMVS